MGKNKHQACIDACNKCMQSCLECYNLCLNEEDVEARRGTMSTLLDCAKMCEMSAYLMSIDSKFAMDHSKLCATVCEKCADACSIFQDEHCQVCSEDCKKCSKECYNMAQMQ